MLEQVYKVLFVHIFVFVCLFSVVEVDLLSKFIFSTGDSEVFANVPQQQCQPCLMASR